MGNSDNPRIGRDFEAIAQACLAEHGMRLNEHVQVEVGAGRERRLHTFDLGSDSPPVLVECKAHTWTAGGNSPSAKLTVWNEAMHYFQCAPAGYRKILFVLRDERRGVTLAEYYLQRYAHLVPDDVEVWEYDRGTGDAVVRHPARASSIVGQTEHALSLIHI